MKAGMKQGCRQGVQARGEQGGGRSRGCRVCRQLCMRIETEVKQGGQAWDAGCAGRDEVARL